MDSLALRIPPKKDARFGPLRAMLETNWEENSPKLYRALKKNGTLDQVLDSRVEQAILVLQQCEEKGLAPDQARELAYRSLIGWILPAHPGLLGRGVATSRCRIRKIHLCQTSSLLHDLAGPNMDHLRFA